MPSAGSWCSHPEQLPGLSWKTITGALGCILQRSIELRSSKSFMRERKRASLVFKAVPSFYCTGDGWDLPFYLRGRSCIYLSACLLYNLPWDWNKSSQGFCWQHTGKCRSPVQNCLLPTGLTFIPAWTTSVSFMIQHTVPHLPSCLQCRPNTIGSPCMGLPPSRL